MQKARVLVRVCAHRVGMPNDASVSKSQAVVSRGGSEYFWYNDF
jgi:hypothetical protein